MKRFLYILLCSLFLVNAQEPGTMKSNNPLPLPIKVLGSTLSTSATIDQNWRWVHNKGGYQNCFDGGWISTYCSDPVQCVKNCQLEGVPTSDYTNVYGARSSQSALTLEYIKGSNVGSRFYLLDPAGKNYQPFNLNNREFTFTVDVSTLGCGTNGALYFVDIPLDGGLNSLNTAGAPFGTGYGDAQGPTDLKYVDGFANLNSTGNFAIEMDIWEANAYATQFTPHPCSTVRTKKCTTPDSCSASKGFCDKPGSDYNPYRRGRKDFYGPGLTIDTTKPITVITQFITDNEADNGNLVKIQRYYKQGSTITEGGFITDESAQAQNIAFKDNTRFAEFGGLKNVGQAFSRGMTLVLSIWDDSSSYMLWLDSVFPIGSTANGSVRGPCPTSSGRPDQTRKLFPTAKVIYSDIQVSYIGSYEETSSPTPPSPTPTLPSPIPPPSTPPSPVPTPKPTPCTKVMNCTCTYTC